MNPPLQSMTSGRAIMQAPESASTAIPQSQRPAIDNDEFEWRPRVLVQ